MSGFPSFSGPEVGSSPPTALLGTVTRDPSFFPIVASFHGSRLQKMPHALDPSNSEYSHLDRQALYLPRIALPQSVRCSSEACKLRRCHGKLGRIRIVGPQPRPLFFLHELVVSETDLVVTLCPHRSKTPRPPSPLAFDQIHAWDSEGYIVLEALECLHNTAEDRGGCIFTDGITHLWEGVTMVNNTARDGGCICECSAYRSHYRHDGVDVDLVGVRATTAVEAAIPLAFLCD